MTDVPYDCLDVEMAFTCWQGSCRDLVDIYHCCRRPIGHAGDHATGFGTGRRIWARDGAEGGTE